MPKCKEPNPEFVGFEQYERMIEAFDRLAYSLDNMQHAKEKDYSSLLMGLRTALDDIGDGLTHEGCLKRIHRELHLLNKTLIMSALLLSATKKPEETLNKYTKIIDEFLN